MHKRQAGCGLLTLPTFAPCQDSPIPRLSWMFTAEKLLVLLHARRCAPMHCPRQALEHALTTAGRIHGNQLIHHSDRGSQYVSLKYSTALAESGIRPSIGTVGDSYDNALAETVNGLYKAELIHAQGPWTSVGEVELATLRWVHW